MPSPHIVQAAVPLAYVPAGQVVAVYSQLVARAVLNILLLHVWHEQPSPSYVLVLHVREVPGMQMSLQAHRTYWVQEVLVVVNVLSFSCSSLNPHDLRAIKQPGGRSSEEADGTSTLV